MKPDFQAMTMRELKKYVLMHRDDEAAFQALMQRVEPQPQDTIYGDVDSEQFSELLKQYRYVQND